MLKEEGLKTKYTKRMICTPSPKQHELLLCIFSVPLKMSGNVQSNKAPGFISSRGPLALKVIKLLEQ